MYNEIDLFTKDKPRKDAEMADISVDLLFIAEINRKNVEKKTKKK